MSAVDYDTDLFARDLVSRLEKGRTDHRYEKLLLVSPPRFLGKLRSHMSEDLRRTVALEIDKDFSREDTRTLAARLHEMAAEWRPGQT